MEFNEDDSIKKTNYLAKYIINNSNYQLVIIITYNKYIFFIIDKICKA